MPRQGSSVQKGALPPDALKAEFPKLRLPVQPPFPPQEAKPVKEIPVGTEWQFEPKWDGFRCLAFRDGNQIVMQSKSGQPLDRYFPELVKALGDLQYRRFVLDGEIVIYRGKLSFEDLLQRIHPAESRIKKLAESTPATLICFDLLVGTSGKSLLEEPFRKRRDSLEQLFQRLKSHRSFRLSPRSSERDQADSWMRDSDHIGFDGVVAKLLDEPYRSDQRTAMVKVKRERTADCVVGGFRYAEKNRNIGSLLLGLYDDEGKLDHVGFTSSFTSEQRHELKAIVEPLIERPGFTGKAPGGPSRWSTKRSTEWEPLQPRLVCEVKYDHFSGGRFRHGTKFLRWRPEKSPKQCRFDQVK